MRAISPAQRKVLDALIAAHPRAATHDFIFRALWPIEADEPEQPNKVLRVIVPAHLQPPVEAER